MNKAILCELNITMNFQLYQIFIEQIYSDMNIFSEFLQYWQQKVDKLYQHLKLPSYCAQITQYATNLATGCQIKSGQLQKIIHLFFSYENIQQKKYLCARIFNNGDYAFFCLDCQKQTNSVQCLSCFSLSDHRGHAYQKRKIPGGCCDCGDQDKWQTKGFCKNHSQVISPSVSFSSEEKENYVNSLQYLLNLVQNIQVSQIGNSKKNYINFLNVIAHELDEFNNNNTKGNLMTAAFLLQKFSKKSETVEEGETGLSILAGFCNEENYEQLRTFYKLIHNVLINLFNVPDFKKNLTEEYIKIINKKPKILLSFLSNITSQIFTSPKLFLDLSKEDRLPVVDSSLINKLTISEHHLFKIYQIFYQHFQFIYSQYNAMNPQQSQYLITYFSKFEITNLSGYEKKLKSNPRFYQIQYLYISKCLLFLRCFTNHTNLFDFYIQSLILDIQSRSPQQDVDLYIPKERTLALIIFIICKGNYSLINFPQFLAKYNITSDILYKILQSVLKVIRFYALNLSNMQTAQRYGEFFSFSLNSKVKTLSSLDFELLKFCLRGLSHLKMNPIQEYSIQPNLPYQAQYDYKTNRLPLDTLLKLPGLMAKTVIQSPPINDHQGNYDRKKALMYFTDYIGILHQVILSNIPELHLKSVFGVQCESDQLQYIEFYGRLLKSIDYVKFEKFKEICQTLLGQKINYLEEFVREYCKIENQWISLKQGSPFEEIDLSYFRSLKSCELLVPFYEGNSKKSNISQLPSNTVKHSKLRQTIFNNSFVQTILQVGNIYLSLFDSHREVFMVDLPHFQKLVQQIIKLVRISGIKQLNDFVIQMNKKEKMMQSLSQKLRQGVCKVIGENVIIQTSKLNPTQEVQHKKRSIQETKAEKIRKFREKQQKIIYNISQIEKIEDQPLHNPQCIICKSSKPNEPLSILCYLQPSNLFSTAYFQESFKVNMVTTCNHYGHKSCLKKNSNPDRYLTCQICKNASNLLIPTVKVFEEPQSPIITKRTINFGGRPPLRNRDIQIKYPEDRENIETIVLHILYGAIVDFRFFVHSLSKPTHYLFVNIEKDMIKVGELIQSCDQREIGKAQNKVYWNAYKYTLVAIGKQISQEKGLNLQKYEENIPSELLHSLRVLINSIFSFQKVIQLQNMSNKPFEEFDQEKKIKFFELPQTLQELSSYMGQCPNCKEITNQIYICLLCKFQTCLGCKVKNLTKHTLGKHEGANAFVRVDEGILCYVTEKRFVEIKVLYQNFLGEVYQFLKKNKKKDYKLKKQMVKKVEQYIIRHRIDQQIRLNKWQFNNQRNSESK